MWILSQLVSYRKAEYNISSRPGHWSSLHYQEAVLQFYLAVWWSWKYVRNVAMGSWGCVTDRMYWMLQTKNFGEGVPLGRVYSVDLFLRRRTCSDQDQRRGSETVLYDMSCQDNFSFVSQNMELGERISSDWAEAELTDHKLNSIQIHQVQWVTIFFLTTDKHGR